MLTWQTTHFCYWLRQSRSQGDSSALSRWCKGTESRELSSIQAWGLPAWEEAGFGLRGPGAGIPVQPGSKWVVLIANELGSR